VVWCGVSGVGWCGVSGVVWCEWYEWCVVSVRCEWGGVSGVL
jgi:hypothetical protein